MSDATGKVIFAGLAANVLVAVSKYVAAFFTGSSSMLSEAVHSTADCMNQVLLFHGMRRARQRPSAEYPLGHGREIYFWSFIVALLIFSLGAGVSVYEGISHILHPHEIESFVVSYAVLGVAVLLEAGSWTVAFKEFRRRKGARGWLQAAEETKDPRTLMMFSEDTAALLGLIIALMGTGAAQLTGNPVYDGIASIAIGLLLAVVALFLARENKRLLIGESARPALLDAIEKVTEEEGAVEELNGLLSFQLSPEEVVIVLSVHFTPTMRSTEVEEAIERLEARIRGDHPEVVMLVVKPQTREAYDRVVSARQRGRPLEAFTARARKGPAT
jgi:cation diffusion facilitator family transporter